MNSDMVPDLKKVIVNRGSNHVSVQIAMQPNAKTSIETSVCHAPY